MSALSIFRRMTKGALPIFLALGVLSAAGSAIAQSRGGDSSRPTATRRVRQTDTHRFVQKRTERTLPAQARHAYGSLVRFQEREHRLVRIVERDGPVQDGTFVRQTRTLTVEGPIPPPPRPRRRANGRVLNVHSSKRLGAFVHRDRMHVRFFAPRAREVVLVDGNGERRPMRVDRAGVWSAVLEQEPSALYGTAYHFEVDGQRTADPNSPGYEDATATSRFVDPDFEWTDQDYRTPAPEDLIIAEEHVRDATAHPSAPVPEHERGTYRGWTNPRVLAHRARLGINAVEALPLHEYGAEARHWGYMPVQFAAPATRYATRPEMAVHELRAAINRLHGQGIAVIADVVFNHTANDGTVGFHVMGPEYFYRMQEDGQYWNGSGTGNEFDTERPMGRRVLINTLRHWVDFFHVDGFRFDIGNLHSPGTLAAVERALPRSTILIAEPFVPIAERAQWREGDLADTRYALWNCFYREHVLDYLGGRGDRSRVQTSVAGSMQPFGFAARPGQSINYLSSHDEHALADILESDPRRSILAATILLTSQGIPMLEHGQEFLRSKQGHANTHDQDNAINWIDWRLAEQHEALTRVYEGLIRLRRAHPHFRYREGLTEQDITWLTPENSNSLGWLLRAPREVRNRQSQPEFLVLTNADRQQGVRFNLPHTGPWSKVMDGERIDLETGLGTVEGDYWVAPGTAVILRRETNHTGDPTNPEQQRR